MSRASGGFVEQRVRVLVVDRLAKDREIMGRFLAAWNFEPLAAGTAGEALELAAGRDVSIAVVTEPVAGMRGMELVQALRQTDSGVETILLAQDDSASYATEAFRSGAYNCLQRPVDFSELSRDLNTLREAVQHRLQRKIWEQAAGSAAGLEGMGLGGMIGFSAPMQAVFASMRRFAPEDSPVLITGLIGTGKELAARALHNLGASGADSNGPLVIYRCCGVSEELATLELFGPPHREGRLAADGAAPSEHLGALQSAQGGTILLDEIGDLPMTIQSRLVAALRTGHRPTLLPARLVAATRMNLADLAARGRFDPELYSLLSRNVLHMPSLGERPEDIPMLCRHFLETFNREYGKGVRGFSSAAERMLLASDWPGNVRELENVIGRACLLADADWIEPADLSIATVPAWSERERAWQGQGKARSRSGKLKRGLLQNPAQVGPGPAVS